MVAEVTVPRWWALALILLLVAAVPVVTLVLYLTNWTH